jgi:DNA-binding GntR family transcriptional regulator
MRPLTGTASLTVQVAGAIRDAIRAGELRPDELYSVAGLAEQLGVSRTPVREALLGLTDSGLVRIERNRGFRVVRRDARYLAEVFHLRLLLEVPAAARAAARFDGTLIKRMRRELAGMRAAAASKDETVFVRHDRAFHDAVLAASGNRLLGTVVAGLRDSIIRAGASTMGRSRPLRAVADEHVPILDAIIAADPDSAAGAMRAHLRHTAELLIAQETVAAPDATASAAEAASLLDEPVSRRGRRGR